MTRNLSLVFVLVAALAAASCGYSLAGRGSFLPASIKSIGVPAFVNQTTYYEVGQMLTQSVRTELIGRGKYKVVPEATGADAVLKAEVTNISLAPTGFNPETQQATRYAITVSLSIQLVQASDNKVLWQNPAQVFREEYALPSGGGAVVDANSFFGQSSAAVERMASDFARSIVTAILEAF